MEIYGVQIRIHENAFNTWQTMNVQCPICNMATIPVTVADYSIVRCPNCHNEFDVEFQIIREHDWDRQES